MTITADISVAESFLLMPLLTI